MSVKTDWKRNIDTYSHPKLGTYQVLPNPQNEQLLNVFWLRPDGETEHLIWPEANYETDAGARYGILLHIFKVNL
jgi:hypothetical protein